MRRYVPWIGGIAGIWLSASASAFSLPDWPPTLALDHTLVQTSLLTRHFDPDPEHTNHTNQLLIILIS